MSNVENSAEPEDFLDYRRLNPRYFDGFVHTAAHELAGLEGRDQLMQYIHMHENKLHKQLGYIAKVTSQLLELGLPDDAWTAVDDLDRITKRLIHKWEREKQTPAERWIDFPEHLTAESLEDTYQRMTLVARDEGPSLRNDLHELVCHADELAYELMQPKNAREPWVDKLTHESIDQIGALLQEARLRAVRLSLAKSLLADHVQQRSDETPTLFAYIAQAQRQHESNGHYLSLPANSGGNPLDLYVDMPGDPNFRRAVDDDGRTISVPFVARQLRILRGPQEQVPGQDEAARTFDIGSFRNKYLFRGNDPKGGKIPS